MREAGCGCGTYTSMDPERRSGRGQPRIMTTNSGDPDFDMLMAGRMRRGKRRHREDRVRLHQRREGESDGVGGLQRGQPWRGARLRSRASFVLGHRNSEDSEDAESPALSVSTEVPERSDIDCRIPLDQAHQFRCSGVHVEPTPCSAANQGAHKER